MNTADITVYEGDKSPYIMTVDNAVVAWLSEKFGISGSAKTKRAYQDGLTSFRALLQSQGYDLDSDRHVVGLAASVWCASSANGSTVSSGTYNQRRSILSSFYKYALRHDVLLASPIDLTIRHKNTPKDAAQALNVLDVAARMALIDRSKIDGLRDYALLSLALTTGRRASELVMLRCEDITLTESTMRIVWRRCKGNKQMIDDIESGTRRAVVAYLDALYGTSYPSDASVFVSFDHNTYHRQLGTQSVADICKKHLGTSKIHATRHTFTHAMEASGASLSDIAARLGHENLKTTSDYLKRLHSSENKYARNLEMAFGIA